MLFASNIPHFLQEFLRLAINSCDSLYFFCEIRNNLCEMVCELAIIYCDSQRFRNIHAYRRCRRTSYGYLCKLRGATVHCKSGTITLTCQSTMEAEYIAASIAVRFQLGFMKILSFLNVDWVIPRVLSDNQAAIRIANDQESLGRTKHLDIRLHSLKEAIAAGQIKLTFVKSALNVSDIFTKDVGSKLFVELKEKVLKTILYEGVDFKQGVVDVC